MASTAELASPSAVSVLTERPEENLLGGARSNRVTNGVLATIALVASVGLVPWLGKPMFRDEGSTLYSAHLSWTALGQQSRVVDLVVLPYYALVHLWIQVSGTIQWVRLLSLLAFGLTVFLVGRLGVRLGGPWCGVVASVALATNPLMVRAALYARPYALTALAATAAVMALVRWLEDGGTKWVWWFCLASCSTVLLQMFSVLVPFTVLAVIAVLRPGLIRSQRRALLVPLGLLVTVTLATVALGAGQRGQIAWINEFFRRRQLITNLLGPAYGGSGPYSVIIVAIVVVATGLCIYGWHRGRRRPERRQLEGLAVVAAWAVLPAAVMVAVSFVHPVYIDRYVTSSAPGLALAVALLAVRAFDVVTEQWAEARRLAVGAVGLAAVALLTIAACTVPAATTYSENLQVAARYLTAHVGPNGEAALTDHSLTTAVDYYLGARSRTVRDWPQSTSQRYINGLDLGLDRHDQSQAPANVWLVDDGLGPPTAGFVTVLTRDGYARSGTVRLPGVVVEHFHRAPDAARP
jgi:hypothetical protein